jgi:hypothetical protein
MDTKAMISMGIDPGFGGLKIYSQGRGLELLSQVAANGGQHLDAMGGLKRAERPLMVETGDGQFYVGAHTHQYGRLIENLNFDRLNNSPEIRALVYGAWTKYMQANGVFDAPLSLMIALPIQTMGQEMREYRNSICEWLKDAHTWKADGMPYGVTVDRARTNSQPALALFDFVLDDEAKRIKEHSFALTSEIGIISVGFNTIELMVVENSTVTEAATGGEKMGVRRLLELLNPQRKYSMGHLDLKLRQGSLNYKDKLTTWANEVNGVIENIWDKALDRFSSVLVVGGGALLLGDLLRLQGKGIVLDNPVQSIARGSDKFNRAKRS